MIDGATELSYSDWSEGHNSVTELNLSGLMHHTHSRKAVAITAPDSSHVQDISVQTRKWQKCAQYHKQTLSQQNTNLLNTTLNIYVYYST